MGRECLKVWILVAVMLVWAIISTAIAVHYSMLNQEMAELSILEGKIVKVNLLIDYGNGTKTWYNNTESLADSTLLEVTMRIAKVEGKTSKYGFYVTSINGVSEAKKSANEGWSWIWYYWDGEKWVVGPVACDKYFVKAGDILMWKYEHWKY